MGSLFFRQINRSDIFQGLNVYFRCICRLASVNPLPDNKYLDSSKLKEFADDNFKFDENGRELSKRVENTVGRGEIAPEEQFLLFPQCFQKAFFPGASKSVIVWEWVKQMTYIKDQSAY